LRRGDRATFSCAIARTRSPHTRKKSRTRSRNAQSRAQTKEISMKCFAQQKSYAHSRARSLRARKRARSRLSGIFYAPSKKGFTECFRSVYSSQGRARRMSVTRGMKDNQQKYVIFPLPVVLSKKTANINSNKKRQKW